MSSPFRSVLVFSIVPIVLLLSACSKSTTTTTTTSGGPTARDLFYRENAASSGGSNTTPGDSSGPASGAFSLELTRDGAEPVRCDNRFVFKSGDALRLHIKVNQPLYVYVVSEGSTGQKALLYPPAGENNLLDAGKECIVPPKGQMVFDDNAGAEHLLVGLFQQPLEQGKALDFKGESIDNRSLTGNPTTVGGLSVLSNFGTNYELGQPVSGDGQVYISNPSRGQPVTIELILKHTKNGDSHSSVGNNAGSSSSSATTSGGRANAAIMADPNCYGILPPYLLRELARRNPDSRSLGRTLEIMQTIPENTLSSRSLGANEHSEIEVYDAGGGGPEALPGAKARFDGEQATGKFETDKVYEYTQQVRDFYKELFNRDSIDGNGMKIISTENFGHNYENAFWNGVQMTYGSPGADSPMATFVLLDVCGHEITHGVTEAEQPLTYYGQAGALNESISDVFGVLIKQRVSHQAAADSNWLVGEGVWKPGINGRALRDLLHPGTAFDDPKTGKDIQAASMKDYICTTDDSGGVHQNSGIPNRAFALFAIDVGGNAWEEPAKIWYETRKVVGPTPSFAQFAFNTIETAKKLGFEDDVPKLEKAWDDVGVTPSETETDTLTPAAPSRPRGSG